MAASDSAAPSDADAESPHPTQAQADGPEQSEAPHPGSRHMPRWNIGTLDDAPVPKLGWRAMTAMLGPGLVLAGAAIGGGEWLMGPAVTARYGASIMWVTTLSLLAQVIYNIEVSRYTLYTGEPIMIGKFRTLPGPFFWVFLYLVADLGSIFPYLAANAATPVAAMLLGEIPNPAIYPEHGTMIRWLSYGIFMLALLPLLFGGKVYNSLKAIMTFKVFFVLGFLFIVAVGYTTAGTWSQILSGFFQFGNMPLKEGGVGNVFSSLLRGDGFPEIDGGSIASLAAFAGIAGVGGLAQTSISNYTREQGWGMGKHVGAIPSLIGGRNVSLSHKGTVFHPTPEALGKWKRWYNHVLRDQVLLWLPACIIGLALPAMLSVEFLPRGTVGSDWTMAGMTADGVRQQVGGSLGALFWYLVLLCGFLTLVPSTSSSADGFVRRWVDVSWTSLPFLRKWDPHKVRYIYFGFLAVYLFSGLFLLSSIKPTTLILIATNIGNFALGISAWHTLYVNSALLPRPLRPGIFARVSLFLAGTYFFALAMLAGYFALKSLK